MKAREIRESREFRELLIVKQLNSMQCPTKKEGHSSMNRDPTIAT